MRCPECNTEILDPKSRFCPNCGSPVKNDNANGNENVNAASEREQTDTSISRAEREQGQSDSFNGKASYEEPQLSRGMMIFIAAGILFLIGFSLFQYIAHKNDPDYTRTMIDPDSTLADKNTVKFDTIVPDTAKRDSIQKAEKREAEKILNSIRKKSAEEKTETENNGAKEPGSEGAATENGGSTTSTDAPAPSAEPAPIVAPKPNVEKIESE